MSTNIDTVVIQDPTGDIIMDAVIKGRAMADQRVLNGLTGRQVSSISDLHIAKGEPITFRVAGDLEEFEATRKITEAEVHAFLKDKLRLELDETSAKYSLGRTPPEAKRGMAARGAHTWTIDTPDTGPLRVHVTLTASGYALGIRLLPAGPPALEALGLPASVTKLTRRRRGLTILAGPVGSGKSTTLAGLLEKINSMYARVIFTLDDAIEYRFEAKKSRFRQIEIGSAGQAPSYAMALSDLLQADPDIVVVSEARDPDAVEAAIQIAERGCWCILTTHLDSAPQVADRIIGAFPPAAQDRIKTSLAAVLQDVIVMNLVKTKNGKDRVVACEVMTRTSGTAQAILKPHEMSSETALLATIRNGKADGMQTMETALYGLVRRQIITKEVALENAIRKDDLIEMFARAEDPNESTGRDVGGGFNKA
jgi:twitching motility protein PilT